jgi:hypothetical protein
MTVDEALKWAEVFQPFQGEPPCGDAEALIALAYEVKRLRISHERYETVCRMSVPQFQDAFILSAETGKPFDQIIDELKPLFRYKSIV